METERLVLRRFTDDDVDNLTALDADPEVRRYLTAGRPTSREKVRDEVLPRICAKEEARAGGESGRAWG